HDTLVRDPGLAPADGLGTTALGRRHLRHRLVVTAPAAELADALGAFVAGRTAPFHTREVDPRQLPTPAFLFSGQGTGHHPATTAALAARFPVVAEVLRECAEAYQQETGGASPFRQETDDVSPFLDRLLHGSDPAHGDTAFAQPALFALQVAQARLWRELGVVPATVAGHSVGEYAALCTAGAFTVTDGVRLLCRRGRLMQRTAPGAMLAVFAPEPLIGQLLADVDGLELAVRNGPEHHVVAGPPEAVANAQARLAEQGVRGEPLPVDRAFHTALLDPMLDELGAATADIQLLPIETEFISGLDGTAHRPGWRPTPDYLLQQARRTADFHAVLRTLTPAHVLLELGPGATLTGLVRHALPDTPCVPTTAPGKGVDHLGTLWTAVARLHCAGVDLNWTALLDGCAGRRIPLPTYPFQRRSHWVGPPPVPGDGPSSTIHTDREAHVTEHAVLERVLDLTAQHLGHDRSALRATETYLGLGADSLQLIGMLRQLEGEFGVRIAVRELLEDAGSPELTARLIAKRAEQPRTPTTTAPKAAAAPTPPLPTIEDAREDTTPYATRAEVAELRRQIDLLAETQAALITQLSTAVALLNAERSR
ncbi:6-deoxyerythronolide-B synthase, partial [Actinobacteria bacterium OK074]